MSIKDWDGTANHEIVKLYDWDGTTSHQLGKGYDWDGTTNSLIYSAEVIVVPNTTDYPSSVYNTSLLGTGGTLNVTDTGATVNTWQTAKGRVHLACLPIDCTGFTTLTYTAYDNSNGDGNYKTTIGFGTAVAENLNIKTIWNGWGSSSGRTTSGTIDVSGYGTIYAIFGQGTTIAGGNYGHGTTGFNSIVLT